MLRLVPTQNRPPMSDKSDAAVDEYALLQRISEGDTSAFEAFYKVYYSRLFRFILRMTFQPELVEELIQETLLVVWESPMDSITPAKYPLGSSVLPITKHSS